MADNSIQFELMMRDDATKVMNNFKANVSTQSTAVQQAFQKMQGATAQSTNALMNFNRVIQDAPYGIMGVANNLNPLLESFQRLSKESGGAGMALRSMLSSLASPAGIGIALAAVSSLAVMFGDKLIPKLDDSKKKTKEAEDAMKSYAEMLNRVIASMKVMDTEMETSRRKVFEQELTMVQGRLKIYRELETQIKNGAKEIIITESEAAKVGISTDELLRFTKQQLADEIKRLSDRAVELNINLNSLGMTIEASPLKSLPMVFSNISANGLLASDSIRTMRKELDKTQSQKAYVNIPEPDKNWMKDIADEVKAREDSFNNLKLYGGQAISSVEKMFSTSNNKQIVGINKRLKAEMESIQQRMTANDEYYNRILANENLTTEQRASINAERKASDDKLAQEKVEAEKKAADEIASLQRKNFEIQKAADIAMILLNGAVAMSKTLATTGIFGVPLLPIIAGLTAAQIGLALAQPNPYHNGGTVGNYANEPSSREFPIMVRGGETVRTEGQERDLQNGRSGKSMTVNININGQGLTPRDVQKAVVSGMRSTGLTVDKYFVNNRSKVVLA